MRNNNQGAEILFTMALIVTAPVWSIFVMPVFILFLCYYAIVNYKEILK